MPAPPISGGPLVSTAWLAEHAGDEHVVVLEVDEEPSRYWEAHVPGALAVDWLDDLHHPIGRDVVDPAGLAALLSGFGVTADSHVVLLGDAHNTYASFAYWLLRYYRHRHVSLVDGGKAAWLMEGRPTTADVHEPAPTTYPLPTPDEAVRATRDDILTRFVDQPPGTALIDCRTEPEFRGREARGVDLPVERHRVPGHVPGARNLNSLELLDPVTQKFRPVTEIRQMFAAREVAAELEVALYCRLAERSSLLWFALHELLHHQHVRNYDGGWVEYGSLIGAPVTRGQEGATFRG